jgi:hypothetical protein
MLPADYTPTPMRSGGQCSICTASTIGGQDSLVLEKSDHHRVSETPRFGALTVEAVITEALEAAMRRDDDQFIRYYERLLMEASVDSW